MGTCHSHKGYGRDRKESSTSVTQSWRDRYLTHNNDPVALKEEIAGLSRQLEETTKELEDMKEKRLQSATDVLTQALDIIHKSNAVAAVRDRVRRISPSTSPTGRQRSQSAIHWKTSQSAHEHEDSDPRDRVKTLADVRLMIRDPSQLAELKQKSISSRMLLNSDVKERLKALFVDFAETEMKHVDHLSFASVIRKSNLDDQVCMYAFIIIIVNILLLLEK